MSSKKKRGSTSSLWRSKPDGLSNLLSATAEQKNGLAQMKYIDTQYQSRFNIEVRQHLHQRMFAPLWVAIILVPFFSILDFVVVREYFALFLLYRVSCSLILLSLFFFYYKEFGHHHPFLLSTVAYLIIGVTLSAMIVKLGGYDAFYYVGLILVLVGFSAILPITPTQSVITGLLLYDIYAVPIFLFNDPSVENLRLFFSSTFFFLSFIVLNAVQSHEEHKARQREFNLRMDLDTHAAKLAYYAQNLEAEGEKRARELEDSELRYRELYENLIDMVALIDEFGHIMMANPRFKQITQWDSKTGSAFSQFVHPTDAGMLERELFAKLSQQQDVHDLQFRLLNQDDQVFQVECNARCLPLKDKLTGYQLVIRDITRRQKLEKDLLIAYHKVKNTRTAAILGLAKLAEYRDTDTGNHLERIREYSRLLAREFAKKPQYQSYVTSDYIEDIYQSCILHDIGKVGIPDSILLKPGRLTPDEYDIIKMHVIYGGDALKAVESQISGQSFLTLGKEIAYFHHERWDGKGYPHGLKGDKIPLSTRFVALADVYDALTSKRCYKDAFSHSKAREIILAGRGTQFDPEVVDAFVIQEQEFDRIRQHLLG
jgi:PAS domain S-box-containing protein